MPANKNAMTRYKILDDLLSNRYHNYSLDDLTEEVNYRLSEMYPDTNGVVRRTIEKDIFYLEYEGPFLADIERYSVDAYNKEKQKSYTKQCLRYANPAFSIFKKQMSADEEYLLSEALTLLGQFDGLPNLGDLEALRLGLGVKKQNTKLYRYQRIHWKRPTFWVNFSRLFLNDKQSTYTIIPSKTKMFSLLSPCFLIC